MCEPAEASGVAGNGQKRVGRTTSKPKATRSTKSKPSVCFQMSLSKSRANDLVKSIDLKEDETGDSGASKYFVVVVYSSIHSQIHRR